MIDPLDPVWAEVFKRQLTSLQDRQDALNDRMDVLEHGLKANNEATARIDTNTSGIAELLVSWDGAMKTINATAKIVRPVTAILVSIITLGTTMWAAWHIGGPR